MKNIVIVTPHPDDETLGCGGTILKLKESGKKVFWLIITNIDIEDGWEKNLVEKRQTEINKVASHYQFDKVFKLDFPTTKMDTIADDTLVKSISKIFNQIKPNIVFLPFYNDVHTDHQKIFKAAFGCTKNFRYPSIDEVLMYEALSETDFALSISGNSFVPNVFNDITPYFKKKLEIFQIYESEVMSENLPRSLSSIEALARYRGSRIGVKYAESFMLLFKKE